MKLLGEQSYEIIWGKIGSDLGEIGEVHAVPVLKIYYFFSVLFKVLGDE
jgi:hypothetical protein